MSNATIDLNFRSLHLETAERVSARFRFIVIIKNLLTDFYGKMTELRMKGVKVIIGAGGLEDSEDEKWVEMTSSPEKIDIFVESVVKFLNRWNFDGLQIAWQYPVCKQVNGNIPTFYNKPCLIVQIIDLFGHSHNNN